MKYPNRSHAYFLRIENSNNCLQEVEIPITAELQRLNNTDTFYSFNVLYRMGSITSRDYYIRMYLF